jgi:hypothetical protein
LGTRGSENVNHDNQKMKSDMFVTPSNPWYSMVLMVPHGTQNFLRVKLKEIDFTGF